MWVPQEEPLGTPAASSTDSIPAGFQSQKLWGLIFLTLEPWAGGPGIGLGLLAPEVSLPNFYPHGCVVSLFRVHASPGGLDGYGFFNPLVVRLPSNSISDVPE